MKCPKCGFSAEEGIYCLYCGTKLEKEVEKEEEKKEIELEAENEDEINIENDDSNKEVESKEKPRLDLSDDEEEPVDTIDSKEEADDESESALEVVAAVESNDIITHNEDQEEVKEETVDNETPSTEVIETEVKEETEVTSTEEIAPAPEAKEQETEPVEEAEPSTNVDEQAETEAEGVNEENASINNDEQNIPTPEPNSNDVFYNAFGVENQNQPLVSEAPTVAVSPLGTNDANYKEAVTVFQENNNVEETVNNVQETGYPPEYQEWVKNNSNVINHSETTFSPNGTATTNSNTNLEPMLDPKLLKTQSVRYTEDRSVIDNRINENLSTDANLDQDNKRNMIVIVLVMSSLAVGILFINFIFNSTQEKSNTPYKKDSTPTSNVVEDSNKNSNSNEESNSNVESNSNTTSNQAPVSKYRDKKITGFYGYTLTYNTAYYTSHVIEEYDPYDTDMNGKIWLYDSGAKGKTLLQIIPYKYSYFKGSTAHTKTYLQDQGYRVGKIKTAKYNGVEITTVEVVNDQRVGILLGFASVPGNKSLIFVCNTYKQTIDYGLVNSISTVIKTIKK
jgi:hypothetical protein